jgi:hypothetical protein
MYTRALIVTVGFWIVTLALLCWALKSSLNNNNRESELSQTDHPDTDQGDPERFIVIYVLIIALAVPFAVGTLFFFPNILSLIQKFLYSTYDAILFFNASTISSSWVPSLFFGLVFYYFAVKATSLFFPRFDRFQRYLDWKATQNKRVTQTGNDPKNNPMDINFTNYLRAEW